MLGETGTQAAADEAARSLREEVDVPVAVLHTVDSVSMNPSGTHHPTSNFARRRHDMSFISVLYDILVVMH